MTNIVKLLKNFLFNIKNKIINHFNKNNTSNDKNEVITIIDNNKVITRNINWELINNLKNFDIVLVKMNNKEIEERDIAENKQKRPFIIKEKNNNTGICYGYYFTSNVNNHYFFKKEQYKGLRVILDRNKYSLSNNSLITTNELAELPYENIIHYMDCIDEYDQKKLEKYINLLNHKPVISNKDNKVIEIGDIILDNNIYYIIYQVDNTNSYAYPIILYDKYIDLSKNHDYFMFSHKIYFVDYKKHKTFNLNDNIYIENRFNYDIVDTIKENKKILKSKQKIKRRH